MRLYSTPQSALAGEVTVLAIIETIAATAFSVWLVVHRGTLTHVVIGACVAPFLLLRTDQSRELAIEWAGRLENFGQTLITPEGVFKPLFGLGIILFGAPLIRPLSLALVAIRHPVLSIRSIPKNWNRNILATDLIHPPEIIPEAETGQLKEVWDLRFSSFINDIKNASQRGKWGTVTGTILIITFWFMPSLAYRYSLKATAIVYLPILWILHDSLVDASAFPHKLEDIQESQTERLKRWYSGFVLVFLVFIPFLLYLMKHEWWEQVITWMHHAHPAVIALLSAFLPTAPSGLEIHGWHLARGINATLTIALFIWADGKLRQISRGTFQKTDAVVAQLNLCLLVRGILTLYIIGCTIYIVAAAVNWKTLWPIHVKWVPWS